MGTIWILGAENSGPKISLAKDTANRGDMVEQSKTARGWSVGMGFPSQWEESGEASPQAIF
jgi:hypothetical protein